MRKYRKEIIKNKMVIKKNTMSGVIAELNGKYWGLVNEDGYCTVYGFGKIEHACLGNENYCKSATDLERNERYKKELRNARLVKCIITTTYEVINET